MNKIIVPDWINQILRKDEHILSKFNDFYATNNRIIKSPNRKFLEYQKYAEISISIDKYSILKSISRFIMVLLGSIAIGAGILAIRLYQQGPIFWTDKTTYIRVEPGYLWMSLLLFMGGIILYGLALMKNKYYYQINSPSFENFQPHKWKNPILNNLQKTMLKSPKLVNNFIKNLWRMPAKNSRSYKFINLVNKKTGNTYPLKKKTDTGIKLAIIISFTLTCIIAFLKSVEIFGL